MKTISIYPQSSLPDSCSSSELLALQVLDDSMAPEFNPGHIVVIDGSAKLVPGAYVLVRRSVEPQRPPSAEICGDWVIRRWNPIDEHQVVLETLNVDWEDEHLNSCDMQIHGVVVQRAGKRRSERRHYR